MSLLVSNCVNYKAFIQVELQTQMDGQTAQYNSMPEGIKTVKYSFIIIPIRITL